MELKIGSKVKCINEQWHIDEPEHCPPVGTIGAIIMIDTDGTFLVKWEKEQQVQTIVGGAYTAM